MKFFSLAIALLSVSSGALAAVTGSCKCGSNAYNQNEIAEAFSAAGVAIARKTTVKGYPKAFTNKPDNIKFDAATKCTAGPFMQFPLHHKTGFTTKDAEGPDRVVYDASSHNFCGCITQTGAKAGTFKQCTY